MIKQALDEYVLANKRKWKHDRSKTIGSSEIGQCARRVFYIKSKQKPDADYVEEWGAAERGNIYEQHLWVPALRKRFGKAFMFAGKSQKTIIDGPLSATPDGLITGLKRNALAHLGVRDIGSNCIMAEAKTADPRTNLSKAKSHNVYQTHVQMGIIRKKTKFKPNFSLLSYADASFMDRIVEFVVPFNDNLYAIAKQRAAKILAAKKDKDLYPEGWIAGGNECRHCPFLRTCGIERRNLPFQDENKPVDPQKRAEIADMVRVASKLEDVIDKNKKELREQEVLLKDRLRELGLRKIPGVVTWSSVKGRIAYDDKAIRAAAIAAGVDVEEFSTVGEPTDRLILGDAYD